MIRYRGEAASYQLNLGQHDACNRCDFPRCNEYGCLFQITRENAILFEGCYFASQMVDDALQGLTGFQGLAKFNALGRTEQFNAENAVEIGGHGLQAPRAMGGHRHMVFLIG